MMLDVLFKIKDEQDPSVSFRRSCRCDWRLITVKRGYTGVDAVSVLLGPHPGHTLQGRHLWLLRNEHGRHQRPCLLN